jgi:preprotein translocase subunit SecD
MVIRSIRFNIYLLGTALAALLAGCESTASNSDKQPATLRVHLEVSSLLAEANDGVPINRARPVRVNVEKGPFLDESHVAEARVLEVTGGFAIQVSFDQQASMLLENISAMNPGKRFAIYSEFGAKPRQKRWLAAPLVSRRIATGMLVFTPDASREEAEQIVGALNRLAIKNGNQAKPKKSKAK